MRPSLVAAAVAALLASTVPAAADVMPGQPTCEGVPWLDCVGASREKTEIESDECTMKEVKRLGLRFHCQQSHNDRIGAQWCRKKTLPPEPSWPGEKASDAQLEAYNEKQAARAVVRERELGSIERELSFGSYSEQYFEEMADRAPRWHIGDAAPTPRPIDPMRLDCFALVDKFRRCSLNLGRCTPYWEKFRELAGREFTFVSFEGRDEHARSAIVQVERRAAPDAAPPIADAAPPIADAAPPAIVATKAPASRSCACDLAAPAPGSPRWPALVLVAAAMRRRRRSRWSR